jgi:hypothetical protein
MLLINLATVSSLSGTLYSWFLEHENNGIVIHGRGDRRLITERNRKYLAIIWEKSLRRI